MLRRMLVAACGWLGAELRWRIEAVALGGARAASRRMLVVACGWLTVEFKWRIVANSGRRVGGAPVAHG
jgi:hypothetical protein